MHGFLHCKDVGLLVMTFICYVKHEPRQVVDSRSYYRPPRVTSSSRR